MKPTFFMQLAPSDTWRFSNKQALEASIRESLQAYPGINVGFTQPIQMRVSENAKPAQTGMVAIKKFLVLICKTLSDIAK